VSHSDTANGIICFGQGQGALIGGVPTANAGCDMNWNTWWVGTRTQWNITKDFYMGLDVLYSKLQSASVNTLGTGAAAFGPGLGAATPVFVEDQDNWSFRFRVHRDFYP
jgi:long-subunit fatty acid transport protein